MRDKIHERILLDYKNRRLIVKGFHPKYEEELGIYFSNYGDVYDVFCTGSSFAFITFSRLKEIPPIFHQFNGRTITAEKLTPYNNPNMKTRVILANGIFNNITNKNIVDYFSKYGEVVSAKKQRMDPISRFAYITFRNTESAERAVMEPIHLIQNEVVDVRKARAKE